MKVHVNPGFAQSSFEQLGPGERHSVQFPAVSLLVSEVVSVAFDEKLEGGCSGHAVGQNQELANSVTSVE